MNEASSNSAPGKRSVPEKALTIEEIGVRLDVTPPTVRALVRSGDLEGFQVGPRGLWRVEPKDLEAYIARRKAIAAAERAERDS